MSGRLEKSLRSRNRSTYHHHVIVFYLFLEKMNGFAGLYELLRRGLSVAF